jgi:dTDP-4-amino-4,6-dideoxy-D-galactose acyltransferase
MKKLLIKKQDTLINYSPYRFVKGLSDEYLVDKTVIEPLLNDLKSENVEVIEIYEGQLAHFFIIKKLPWDSEYFGFENFKIINVLFDHNDINILIKAIGSFKNDYCNISKAYYFLDIPSEETLLQQAFTGNGFRLIESRLNYYFDKVKDYKGRERFGTRLAIENDAESLKEVAMKMKNNFDRVHADAQIDSNIADKYIGQFAFNSVMGFADFVLVPSLNEEPPFGFLAFNKPTEVGGVKVAKLVLAAIDNSKEKGWLYKLLSESIYLLQDYDVDYLTTITQTSNTPAFKTWEKFGFKLGNVTNILALKND